MGYYPCQNCSGRGRTGFLFFGTICPKCKGDGHAKIPMPPPVPPPPPPPPPAHRTTLRHTHTFATLEVSPDAYEEIARLLLSADYDHVFVADEPTTVGRTPPPLIDMHGIALKKGPGVAANLPAPPPAPANLRINESTQRPVPKD